MQHVVIIYASVNGSSAEIANFMGDVLTQKGYKSTVYAVEQVTSLAEYDAIILGTSIHFGMWQPSMRQFVHKHQEEINQKPLYFWISCLRLLEPDGYEHAMQHYLNSPSMNGLKARQKAVFAGKLDLNAIDWASRWLLTMQYDGNTQPERYEGDFRDWNAITEWINVVSDDISTLA